MRSFPRSCLALLASALALYALPAAAEDWPQWGGPNRNFQVEAPGLTEAWGEDGPPRLWSRPLGRGYSAVVAVSGILYTMYGAEDDEEIVVALDARSGETLWEHRDLARPDPRDAATHEGPSSTPLVAQGRVVAVGSTGRLQALDAETGELLWSYDLVRDFEGQRLRFGYAASPLLYGNAAVVLVGGKKQGVLAFDLQDGSVRWKSDPFYISYASPIAIRVDGQDQIVFLSAEEVLAVDATSGAFLWREPCRNGFANNASDPVWGSGNLLWVASQPGYGARALRLSRHDGGTRVERLWSDPEISLHYWNAIRVGDHVYASIGPDGEDLAAVDVRTGEVVWREADRFEKARGVHAGDKTIFLDETGRLFLTRVSPQGVDVLSEAQIFDGGTRTAPTLVGTTLYARDASRLVALDLRPSPKPSGAE